MEARRYESDPAEWKKMQRGWGLGDEAFRKELLAQMNQPVGEHHFGAKRQESEEERAEPPPHPPAHSGEPCEMKTGPDRAH